MLRLSYSGISDVGRVRKDNQDSGYAGPHLLAVCDGVGGAARGDIASSVAIAQLRRLDVEPTDDPLALIAGALQRAHDKIAEEVDEDPALAGTSTTATLGLLHEDSLAMGHVWDSRAYLLCQGTLSQLSTDHTFVQTLVDSGRITEEEARTHPQRNLILRALDGSRELEPDLFLVPLQPGDRLLFCSDGVMSLPDPRLADIMGTGTPDFVAVELVRAALEAGSTDNVTAIVADVLSEEEDVPEDLEPLLLGAAAELPRRGGRGPMPGVGGLFRGHRSGDTGEIPRIEADIPAGTINADPPDPESLRYALGAPERFFWTKRLLIGAIALGLVWIASAFGYHWTQQQFYVGVDQGQVTIFRGIDSDLPGIKLSHPYETSDVSIDRLSDFQVEQIRAGIEVTSLDAAREKVQSIAKTQLPEDGAP